MVNYYFLCILTPTLHRNKIFCEKSIGWANTIQSQQNTKTATLHVSEIAQSRYKKSAKWHFFCCRPFVDFASIHFPFTVGPTFPLLSNYVMLPFVLFKRHTTKFELLLNNHQFIEHMVPLVLLQGFKYTDIDCYDVVMIVLNMSLIVLDHLS